MQKREEQQNSNENTVDRRKMGGRDATCSWVGYQIEEEKGKYISQEE